ncbi:MAG: hypothetical protein ACXWUP_09880 [Allosphingosinicella sp.]
MRTLKIAICIPVYGMTHAKFTQSLASLIIHSLGADVREAGDAPVRLELETFMVSCSMLTESRHRLVAEALVWEADHMLWLDADHVFPPDALLRLLAHGLPAVGCNYPRRFAPTAPTAAVATDEEGQPGSPPGACHLLYTTGEKAEAGLIEPVAHLGFGLLLLDMRVFDALQAVAERSDGAPPPAPSTPPAASLRTGSAGAGSTGASEASFLPLFKFEETANTVGMIGEDVFFFGKLAAAGIRPFVDHRLSWEVGHLFEIVLTNGHAVAQKARWAEHRRTRAAKFAHKAAAAEERDGHQ